MRRRALSATAAPSWSRVAPSVWAHGVDVGAPAAPRTTHRVFGGPAAFVPPRAFGYELPTSGVPEVAFAGRSNVGKSTLVGALLGDPSLLRRSKTPGCTTSVNFFAVGGRAAARRGGARGAASDARRAAAAKLFVVDLPGFGYARRGGERREAFGAAALAYLSSRPGAVLRQVCVLVDARRGPDPAVLESFSELRVPRRVELDRRSGGGLRNSRSRSRRRRFG